MPREDRDFFRWKREDIRKIWVPWGTFQVEPQCFFGVSGSGTGNEEFNTKNLLYYFKLGISSCAKDRAGVRKSLVTGA